MEPENARAQSEERPSSKIVSKTQGFRDASRVAPKSPGVGQVTSKMGEVMTKLNSEVMHLGKLQLLIWDARCVYSAVHWPRCAKAS